MRALRERVVGGLRGHTAHHAAPVFAVGVATVLGALAASAFQVIAARAVGVANYGQLAAFLALLNVAAFTSSALQNAVAVASAGQGLIGEARRGRVSEATILGLSGGVVLALLTPVLVHTLNTTPLVVLLAAAAIPLTFWVAQSLGLLQGAGRSTAAVWWTTNSLLIRVALVLLCVALGLGVGAVLAAVLISMAAAVVGAGLPARRLPRPRSTVFSTNGQVVLGLSLLAAWLVNSDIIVVRATAENVIAGNFASAAVLVKAAFTLPAALSIYLLPRFVRTRDNARLQWLGQWVTIAVTAAAAVVLCLVFWLFGGEIAPLILGSDYTGSVEFLLPLALAYVPWIVAQGVMIRLIAHASRSALAVLGIGAAAQVVGFVVVAPDITGILWVQAVIGTAVLAALLHRVRGLDRALVERSALT
ncbi:MAG TPA: oligosaccharide flippase family protein [Jiangellales bacterium]|nr:oligosaccharide flippase family protein [Jiangellales bacterium]